VKWFKSFRGKDGLAMLDVEGTRIKSERKLLK
jgi:hypothetical protein